MVCVCVFLFVFVFVFLFVFVPSNRGMTCAIWIKKLNLTRVRETAAKILKCGKNKVWMDPAEQEKLVTGNNYEKVKQMVEDGLLIRRPDFVHSRGRARQFRRERAKGRHRGLGRRSGTKNARLPEKKVWMERLRKLRKLLAELRESGRIDKSVYRELYLKAKGNSFKSPKLLLEHITAEELRKKKEEILIAQMRGEEEKLS